MEALFSKGATDFTDSFCLNPPAEEIFIQESTTQTQHLASTECTGRLLERQYHKQKA